MIYISNGTSGVKAQISTPRYYDGHYLCAGNGTTTPDKLELGTVGSLHTNATEMVTNGTETATVTPTFTLKKYGTCDFYITMSLSFSKKLSGKVPIVIEYSDIPNGWDTSSNTYTFDGKSAQMYEIRSRYGLFYTQDTTGHRRAKLTVTPAVGDTTVDFDAYTADAVGSDSKRAYYSGDWEFSVDELTFYYNGTGGSQSTNYGFHFRITYGSKKVYLFLPWGAFGVQGTYPKYTDEYANAYGFFYTIPASFTETSQATKATTFTL